jgi:hypothetical protein
MQHTERGECRCGRCIDAGTKPDPTGHTADMVLFKVALRNTPVLHEFVQLSKSHQGSYAPCNVFDGNEHGYIELGAWLGDQGLAIQYMALGHLLGAFDLLTPDTVLGTDLPTDLRMQLATAGYVTVKATAAAA